MKYWFCFLALLPMPLFASKYPVKLGDTVVAVQNEQHGSGKSFIHLHKNETTALKAIKSVVKTDGGYFLTLIHPGGRNIVFHLQKKRYEFDPNRIFTDVGIKKTLNQFGNYTPEAHQEVKKLASQIKSLLPKGKIIAVHNNRSYSFKDYLPGHNLAGDAQELNISAKQYYRNFYLVTQKTDYLRFKQLDFNSILQASHATDDGSLSVYLTSNQYINVEAGYDQLPTQIAMLKHA